MNFLIFNPNATINDGYALYWYYAPSSVPSTEVHN